MRHIDTTVSLSSNCYFLMQSHSRKQNLHIKTVFVRAIRKAIIANSASIRNCAVLHQSLDSNLVRLHISIPVDLYEILVNIRSTAKLSVSKMIADAIVAIMSEDFEEKVDSYRIERFEIRKKVSKSKVYSFIRWEIKEPEIPSHLRQP